MVRTPSLAVPHDVHTAFASTIPPCTQPRYSVVAEGLRQSAAAVGIGPLPWFRFPGIPQHPHWARKVLGNNVADGVGNGWAEIQPGELVHRHPLPAGQYWVTAVQARLRLLPYLRLIDQVDDVPVRCQRFADDDQPADARLESELLAELALESRIQ